MGVNDKYRIYDIIDGMDIDRYTIKFKQHLQDSLIYADNISSIHLTEGETFIYSYEYIKHKKMNVTTTI
jgi:hypothetical protein